MACAAVMAADAVIIDGSLTEEERVRTNLQEVLRHDGGSPEGVMMLLRRTINDRTWERLPSDNKGTRFASFTAFVESSRPYGLGLCRSDLEALLRVRTAEERNFPGGKTAAKNDQVRAEIRRLLGQDIPPARGHGGPRKQGSATPLGGHPRDAAELVARLKRDDPTLADQVVRGQITPNAAAISKKWRKPRIVLSSPQQIADAIRKHLTPEETRQLAELLTQNPGNVDLGVRSHQHATEV